MSLENGIGIGTVCESIDDSVIVSFDVFIESLKIIDIIN